MANRSDFNSVLPRRYKRLIALSPDAHDPRRARELRKLFMNAHDVHKKYKNKRSDAPIEEAEPTEAV